MMDKRHLSCLPMKPLLLLTEGFLLSVEPPLLSRYPFGVVLGILLVGLLAIAVEPESEREPQPLLISELMKYQDMITHTRARIDMQVLSLAAALMTAEILFCNVVIQAQQLPPRRQARS